MADLGRSQPSASDAAEAALGEYRSLSSSAVVGLILGLLSPLAFWHQVLWALPVAGTAVCAVALARIRRAPDAWTGRGMAQSGLGLSLLFGAAAPAQYAFQEYRLVSTAQAAADRWFAYLRADDPANADYMGQPPSNRYAPRDNVWEFYRREPGGVAQLREFVDKPLIRTLLALGETAQARPFVTIQTFRSDVRDKATFVYAVSYRNADDELESFFVQLGLERLTQTPLVADSWQVRTYDFVDIPPEQWNRAGG